MEVQTNLSDWMEQILQAQTRKEIFEILDRFRKHDWTDEERAQMSRLYVRRATDLPKESVESGTAGGDGAEKNESDGPVWYEKM